jgi:hypothetical protein
MNCDQARLVLAELPYGNVPPAQRRELEQHLAECPACASVGRELEAVRRLLDQAPEPTARVDLAALYRRAAELEQVQRRRWRRLAWAASAAAAVVLLALGLRFELRWHERALVVGWGMAPPPNPVVTAPPLVEPKPDAQLLADRQLVHDLIHALDWQLKEGDKRLVSLEKRFDDLDATAQVRWTATQKNVQALYQAYLTRDKGATP